jgi:Fe-Mn family superoxide dismutase
MAYSLPDLPYEYEALEPYIDAETMETHHSKHHQAYTNNLNKALSEYEDLQRKSIEALLGDLDAIPEAIRTAVRNNGGGWHNHCVFWETMAPSDGVTPAGAVIDALSKQFSGFDKALDKFLGEAKSRFGSGWSWIALTPDKRLEIYSLPNQDSPLMKGHTPILGVDVWEHAYYLKYQNRRPEYLDAFLKVINWKAVNERYTAAMDA